MKRCCLLLCTFVVLAFAPGCASDEGFMHDGYYSAVAASFDEDGWKDFVTLYIQNNRIITAEFNARNASGLALSWDIRFLRRLKAENGIHPNQIIREYTRELLNRQDLEAVRRVRGDTRFHPVFVQLASMAIAQARAGDRSVAEVRLTGAVANAR